MDMPNNVPTASMKALCGEQGAMLVSWQREAVDEIVRAHAVLTGVGIPFKIPGSDNECTLAARITMLAEKVEEARGF